MKGSTHRRRRSARAVGLRCRRTRGAVAEQSATEPAIRGAIPGMSVRTPHAGPVPRPLFAPCSRVCGHMVKVRTPAQWRLVSARFGAFCDERMSACGSSRFSSSHPPVHPASEYGLPLTVTTSHHTPGWSVRSARERSADRARGKATRAGSRSTRSSPGSGTLQAHGIITARGVVASTTNGITTAHASLQGLTDT